MQSQFTDKAQAALNELKCDNYTKKQVKNLIDANVKSDWDKIKIKKHVSIWYKEEGSD